MEPSRISSEKEMCLARQLFGDTRTTKAGQRESRIFETGSEAVTAIIAGITVLR